MSPAWLLSLCGALGLSLWLRAATDAEMSSSRELQSKDWEALRSYSNRLGRDWIKDSFGLDLDAMAVEMDPNRLLHGSEAHAPAAPAPMSTDPAPGLNRFLSLRLEQTDDLRRLQQDLRDIPFGLSIEGGLALLETKLWVPFSWKDSWRAEASLPLLGGRGGFHGLTLRSDYRNQLGLSRLDTGLGTSLSSDAWGIWNLNYDFQRNFGQGSEEAVHWLKLSKDF